MGAALSILFGMFGGISFPCDPSIPLKPEEQPTQAEIIEASWYAGNEHIPTVIAAIPAECINADESAAGVYYFQYDILFLMNGWREDGGLTILAHELRHAKQNEPNDLIPSECDAADIGARFAYSHKEWDRWTTEFIYGTEHCIGGNMYNEPWGSSDEWPKVIASYQKVWPELMPNYSNGIDMRWWGFLAEAAQEALQEDGKDVDSD